MADIFQQFSELENRLNPLKDRFESLQKQHAEDQQWMLTTLAQQSNNAMNALFAVAKLLNGNFNPLEPPAEFPARLNDCVHTWDACQHLASANFDCVSKFSQVIVQFHDGEARDLQNALDSFRNMLEITLKAQNDERETRQRTLHDQGVYLESCRRAYEELQSKKSKADIALKLAIVAACATLGLGGVMVAAAALAVQQLGVQLGQAGNTVQVAEDMIKHAQQQVNQSQAEISNLQSLIDREKTLETQVPGLLSRCHDLIKENEAAQAEVVQVKTIRLGVMELIGMCYNRAELSRFALSKQDYGSSILQTVDMAMSDITLIGAAKTIVDCLADNDDEQQSIHKLIRPEHVDENYLAFLQARLAKAPCQNTEPSFYTVARAVASLGAGMAMPSKVLLANPQGSTQPSSSLPEYLELKSALMTMVV